MHIKRIHEMMEKLTAYAECEVDKAIECENYDVNVIGGIIDMVKDLAEAEKDARIAKGMQEAEEEEEAEEKYMLRMFTEKMGEDDGRRFYDQWRYKSGRFAPKGRGHRSGYTPYLHMMDEPYDKYDFMEMPNYRMGYSGGRSGSYDGQNGRSDMRRYDDGDYEGDDRYGYSRDGRSGRQGDGRSEGSRYGRSYDNYRSAKRHYTESKNPEEQKKMKEHIDEIFDDMSDMTSDIVKDLTPEERQKYKQKLQTMMQKMQ